MINNEDKIVNEKVVEVIKETYELLTSIVHEYNVKEDFDIAKISMRIDSIIRKFYVSTDKKYLVLEDILLNLKNVIEQAYYNKSNDNTVLLIRTAQAVRFELKSMLESFESSKEGGTGKQGEQINIDEERFIINTSEVKELSIPQLLNELVGCFKEMSTSVRKLTALVNSLDEIVVEVSNIKKIVSDLLISNSGKGIDTNGH